MKSTKQLEAIFNKANKDRSYYYNLEDFKADAKAFLKDVKNRQTICHMDVSKSGMNRKFNFDRYNMLLNICYNGKMSFEPVKVQGCGMDMHWHLKFRTCEELYTKKELEKNNLNYACSFGKLL
jgi:hypothetical protein